MLGETHAGASYEIDMPHERGSLRNPLSEQEVVEKFVSNASLALTRADVRALHQAVACADELSGLDAIGGRLRRAASQQDYSRCASR